MITHWKGDPPTAPYYAVIFISQKSEQLDGYAEADAEMMSEAQKQEGYLGYSSSGEPKQGIFISYWQDQESIQKWRAHSGHIQAKQNGKQSWNNYYHSIIAKVERSVIHGEWLEGIQ